jgi:selenocysteine lyase/cysteine desulfurase
MQRRIAAIRRLTPTRCAAQCVRALLNLWETAPVTNAYAGAKYAIETQTALPAVVDGVACLCLRVSAAEYSSVADFELLLAAINDFRML